ncbi:MAG: VOC family protein [Parvularculaceae bacterium]
MSEKFGFHSALTALAATAVIWLLGSTASLGLQSSGEKKPTSTEERSMQVQYLEIVTPNVEETCTAMADLHGVTFAEPEPNFGGARIAALSGGGRIGVRAPRAEHDTPIVRPYLLVDDIEAAIAAAEAAGAEFAMKATEIPGHGKFAIYVLGGVQYGLWEL